MFVELYAGFAGFSNIVREVCGGLVHVLPPLERHHGWEIETAEGMKLALDSVERADHVHIAWPCRSFSRARRSDEHGEVEVVRSSESPMGWGHPVAEEGNGHLDRVEKICAHAENHGATASLENPWDSFAWDCKLIITAKKRKSMEEIYLEQCAYGGMSVKPTQIATDAAWMKGTNLTCRQVGPHKHAKLVGKVWDPLTQKSVWKTSKAAEYPTGLCLAWARALKEFLLSQEGIKLRMRQTYVKVGQHANVLVRADLKRPDQPAKQNAGRIQDESFPLPATVHDFNSKREAREFENQQAVGGLRNPRKAVRANSALRLTGLKVRSVLQKFLSATLLHKFEARPTENPFSDDLVMEVRHALAVEFGAAVLQCDGYQNDLIRKLLSESQDPDFKVIPLWLDEGFPLGINCPIPNTGVFPQTDQVSEAVKISGQIGIRIEDWDGTAANYSSFVEAGTKGQAEIQRVIDSGWADVFDSWPEVVEAFGEKAQLTPLACIIKQAHGREKIRLVVDMRRSSVNGQIDLKERVILPRVCDVAEGVRSLSAASPHEIELLVCDFKDAFLTLKLHPSERPHVIVKDNLGRYVAYSVAAFGLASAPLIWSRLAAMGCRLAQACVLPNEAMIHTYVDDPIISVAGVNARARSLPMCLILLLWATLGFKLSWGKVTRGQSIDWIGVQLEVSGTPVRELSVRLSKDKCVKLASMLQELLDKPMVSVKTLRHAAGLLGWLSGIVIEARPWLAMLWAALIQTEQYQPKKVTTRRKKGLVYRKQIQHACTWLLRLLQTKSLDGALQHRFQFRPQDVTWYTIECDACPTGMGAVLLLYGKPVKFWKAKIGEDILSLLGSGAENSPKFQTEFEMFALFLSVKVFQEDLSQPFAFFIRTDNSAALQAALEYKAKSPLLVQLTVELMLEAYARGWPCLKGRHIQGVLNDTADKLSRGEVPPCLVNIPQVQLPPFNSSLFQAWPTHTADL